jgi:large subunit ribosomal protein L13
MKTYSLKGKEVQPQWHVIDAEGQALGRLATGVAHILRGKYRPGYTPHLDNGDFVIVVNASKLRVTGSKIQQKVYRRHSGYPGGLKETSMERMLADHPDRVVHAAVKGMLPHNRLSRKLLKHLKIYNGPEHPHEAQVSAGKGRSKAAAAGDAKGSSAEAKDAPVEDAAGTDGGGTRG